MEKENESYIESQLNNNTKYKNDYKILEEMGYDKLMIKKVYAYINPEFIEYSIKFMTKIDDIYQHEFFPDENKINKCYFCGEEINYHINYENKNKRKDENNYEGKIIEGKIDLKLMKKKIKY